MTMQPSTQTDAAVVQAVFQALASGDAGAIGELFHPDATWNHRNDDRFAGVHQGVPAIMAYLGESAQLTAGTLHPVPQAMLGDGAGHVAVLVQLGATRPDGRRIDDRQMLLVTLDGGRVRSIEQFVGDPPAVAAFWA